ncbi:uncharacterized protein LOC128733958 [Sabethes cyaneus]|uniref:uncharacterized protein LOC128733958 n=1 Tax=Sabethes cyaneus TaxID=53552 RepID=UPI00237E9619|nr:uncharacterized protein LOC128733958 [Sabethes cyaneus]
MVSRFVYCIVTVAVFAVQSREALADDVDFRAFDFGDEDTEFFSSYEKSFNEQDYFPTDFNLGNLELISATPHFAKAENYINPDEVKLARTKRKTASSEEEPGDSEDDEEDGNDRSVDGPDGYVDRYERFVNRHFRDRDQQRNKDNDDSEKEAGGYQYRFDFTPSDDYERIKQESEAQSRRLAKNPKNCQAYEKDGMVCHVCKDPATETTSESCAYATVPHHNKFSYVKQKHYNSKDNEKEEPEDDRDSDSDDDAEEDEDEEHSAKQAESITLNPTNPTKKPKVTPTKKTVVHTKPGQGETNGGGYRYQPVDLRSNRKRPHQVEPYPTTASVVYPAYYDFYTHFLPTHGRSQKILQAEPITSDDVYVLSYRNDDEVAKVLADFETRDWSNCKKGMKNDLTCYTCTDKNGVKHEECMYVSESRQVGSSTYANAPATQAPDVAAVTTIGAPKATKKSPLKKASSEKKPTSPKQQQMNGNARRQSAKLLQLEPAEQQEEETHRGEDRQTVKRTVTIRSHVDATGGATGGALQKPMEGERVMHYEHHVTHVL